MFGFSPPHHSHLNFRFVHNIDRNHDGLIQYSEFFDAMQRAERSTMPMALERRESGSNADAAFLVKHGMKRRDVVIENARLDPWGNPLALPASERTRGQVQYEKLGHWGGLRGTTKAEDAVRERVAPASNSGVSDADILRQQGMARKRDACPPPPPARASANSRPKSTFGASSSREGMWLHMSPSKAHLAPKAKAPISPVFFDRAYRAESRRVGVADILG